MQLGDILSFLLNAIPDTVRSFARLDVVVIIFTSVPSSGTGSGVGWGPIFTLLSQEHIPSEPMVSADISRVFIFFILNVF